MVDRSLASTRSVVAAHPRAFDAALGVLVAVVSIVVVRAGPGPHNEARAPNAVDVLLAVVAATLIAMRRHRPLPVLIVSASAAVVAVVAGVDNAVLLVATFILLFTVALRTNRKVAWIAGDLTAGALFLSKAFFSEDGWSGPATFGILAWCVMAVAIGDGLRTRRAYVAAIEERARRAEQTRDEEARRRVVEERLRIARELHDVVAHHIAMINVQAGVAAHVLRQQPEQAEEALGHVRKSARTVLDEISTLLGVLRREDEPEDSEPTRGLARLSGLLDALAAAGMQVEHSQEGAARELPSAVDLAAYRIVQESLTNAQKHGSEPAARLLVGYTPKGVQLLISNAATGAPAANGSGHGLVGMRERAAAVGGTLQTGREDSRFVVQAFLPTPAVRS